LWVLLLSDDGLCGSMRQDSLSILCFECDSKDTFIAKS
jgi:hypothetical protein